MDFDTDIDFGYFNIMPIKPAVIAIFITVFGGIGIIQTKSSQQSLYALFISFVAAFITSYLIDKYIFSFLKKAENTSSESQKKLIGQYAKVISTIVQDGFGQIKYSMNGNTYNSPAKHIEGKRVEFNSKVVIVLIEKDVFYVDTI
ncbi:NfeD family protein [Tepidibacter mesophilus]|uniref:NfeD family protein n=1 Tax=Tepidibacter mesophilus TaxID=655607 RepID=UPI000C07AEF9|nr:NfeD family protein [Tepidibacter mesophilus]